ncbi:MAG: hypothetical protein M3394_05045, partial [Actinomycetota bacterium]|nr:hypothetical protein [Actinomycetota bacterium]
MRHLFRGAVVGAAAVILASVMSASPAFASSHCELSIADVSQAEGDTGTAPMTFTVTATPTVADACQGVVVSYTFDDSGSADRGSDFTATDGAATAFPGGTTTETRTFSASVIGDTEFEEDENFFVEVTVTPNGKTVSDSTLSATGTIANDDPPPPGLAPGATLSRSPASGPPGTVVNVSGTGCTNTQVEAFIGASQGESGGPVAEKTVPVNADGTWATTLAIPEDADPDFMYTIGAMCGDDFYDSQPFDVIDDGDAGYRMVAADGGIFSFGRNFHGSTG